MSVNTHLYIKIIAILLSSIILVPTSSWAISLKEEIELGQKFDEEILKQTPQITNKDDIAELEQIGAKLVENVKRPEIEYHFRILDDDTLNAFAIPGGYIYFSKRLWDILRPDERKGVLAHEIVHVDRRHSLDAISKLQRRSIWLSVLLSAVGANQTWFDIAGILNNLYTLKYSRGDERQADEVGVELLEKASFNPAGLLLAMRKIKRFEDESGAEIPKIFSSHPPTKERLKYLEDLLIQKNIPVPPETVGTITLPNKIGEVVSISKGEIAFTSTMPLKEGDIVWVITDGWDSKYENKTQKPIAKVTVKSTGDKISGSFRMFPNTNQKIRKGMAVFAPPLPDPEKGIGYIEPAPGEKSLGRLSTSMKLNVFDRLLAVKAVWDPEKNDFVNGYVGYVVVTNPNNPTGYVLLQRPRYSYAPVSEGAAVIKLNDKDANRWIGPIVSVGKSDQAIEIITDRNLDRKNVYDVLYPAWNSEDSYDKRIVAKARFYSSGNKVILRITSYTPGYDINSILNGFDVYEADNDDTPPEPKQDE